VAKALENLRKAGVLEWQGGNASSHRTRKRTGLADEQDKPPLIPEEQSRAREYLSRPPLPSESLMSALELVKQLQDEGLLPK
jgi:hypothetical protein